MKNFGLFLLLLATVFAGSYVAAGRIDANKRTQPRVSAVDQFNPAPFTLKNNPFAIVIIGRNNGATVPKTLSSVFAQNYENFRVIYIDDASDDGSYDLARDLIYDSSCLGVVTLVRNEEKLGHLANVYRAVQTCKDDEIVLVLQGEDWLAHEWVLQRLNAYYADPDLWLACAQYRDFPTYQLGARCELANAQYRLQSVFSPHLKTFQAALFKKIKESDFTHAGKFFPSSSDLAYMIPMVEMAKEHACFIPEILYIYNRTVPHKEDRESQLRYDKIIRSLAPYPELVSLQVNACGD